MTFKVILTEHTLYKKMYKPKQWEARISSLKSMGFNLQLHAIDKESLVIIDPYKPGSIELNTAEEFVQFALKHGYCLVFIDEDDGCPVIEIE